MRAVVDTRIFHKAVTFAATGCHHNLLLPLLNNIKIEATSNKNKLVLMGTDMEFAVQVTVNAQVEKEGATTVNAKQLLSLLSLMKNMGKVEIESNGLFKLRSEEAEHEFPVISTDEFPLFPDEPQGLSFSLPQDTLKRMLQCAMFAMGDEPTLSCVLFEIEKVPQKIGHGYRFNCVATDTYRMSIVSEKINDINEVAQLPRITVPSNSVHKLFKVLQEMDEEIKIVLSPSLVWLEIPHSDMTVHCAISNLGRDFPNYERILTLVEHPITQLKVSSVDLYQALKKIEPHTKTIKNPRIVFDITPECIVIKFAEPDAPSEGKVKVSVVEFEGEHMQIAFNFNFIFEFIKEAKRNSAFVIMSLKGSRNCVKIDCSNEAFSYYIMPMELPAV